MSAAKKSSARQELENIEAALIESILSMSASELRHELTTNGIDPDALIKEVDEVIGRARTSVAKRQLDRAKTELAGWRARNQERAAPGDPAVLRARFDRVRNGDPTLKQKMMVAARKGEGISDHDVDGVVGDLTDLDHLENEIEDQ
jgi:hypothetical protein